MTSITKSGWDSIGTWLLSMSYAVAFMRLAQERSSSGLTAMSWLATMYQLGLVFQATPGALLENNSVDGGAAVAQTICCSSSVRSPQKSAVASLSIQTRPSAIL